MFYMKYTGNIWVWKYFWLVTVHLDDIMKKNTLFLINSLSWICIFNLDQHHEIDNMSRLRTKLYDRDYFNVPIVNFPFIHSNIPAAPIYSVYIFQSIRYSRAFGSYPDILYRGLLLTRNLWTILLGKPLPCKKWTGTAMT